MTEAGEPPVFETLADYFWPGQIDDCLRNKLGIDKADDLDRIEHELADIRLAELQDHPIEPSTFDLAHFQAVHHYLFQDVYEWAGQLRVVDAVKRRSLFTPPDQIEAMATVVFGHLADQDYLQGRSKADFVDGLTTTLTAVNILRPFRDGNGRATRAWSEQLAASAGHVLLWERLGRVEQTEAFTAAFELDPEPLREALDHAIVPVIRGASVDTDVPSATTNVVTVNRSRGQWGFPVRPSSVSAEVGTFGAVSDAIPAATVGAEIDVAYGAER